MAKRRKNLGGFSMKRALGVTKVKSRISRATGVPLSRSGRQRKIGKMMGGCLIPTVIIAAVLITALSAVL